MKKNNIGERLQTLIDAKGINQKKLAGDIGSSAPQVSDWRSGKREISKPNLAKLAKYFGVEESWLSGGEGATPDIIQEKSRADYSEKTGWNFRVAPPDGSKSGGDMMSYGVDVKKGTLEKEDGQNTSDAGENIPGVTEQVISVIRLKGKPLERFKKAMKWDDFSKHLREVAKEQTKFGKKMKFGLEKCKNEIILLRLEDYNAIGLTGPESDDGNFTNLTKNELYSLKASGTSGGNHGLGKGVYWASSWINTVLFHSNLSKPEPDGHQNNRIIGRTNLCYHKVGENKYSGPGWFGQNFEYNGAKISVSMWDNEQLASDLCMQRDSKKGPGTTTLIIGYLHYNESDSDDSPKALSHEIMNNTAKWFTPALAENKLRAYVKFIDTVDDKLEEVTSEKVDVENHMEPFFDMLIKDVADETSTTLSEPGDVVRLKVPLIVPERRLEGHEHDEFTHQAKLLIRYAHDDEKDQLFQHMSFNRGVGMTVNFKSYRNITFCAIPFHAILLCGTSAGYDKKTDFLADQFLRTAEPPAHDRWGPTDELKTDYKLGGIKKIKDFFDEAKKIIESQVGPITPKGTDGPNFLKNFFRFDIVNPASPAFTVKEVDRIIDGDSTALYIKVRKSGPAEKKIFEMEPIVYLEDESGHAGQGQSATIEIKEVISVSGCSEDDGRILIKPEKRIGTFKVLLDEDKLLVPQHLSVFDVELKSIRGRETD